MGREGKKHIHIYPHGRFRREQWGVYYSSLLGGGLCVCVCVWGGLS